MSGVEAGGDAPSRAARTAAIRKFMTLREKRESPSVIRSNCLQVKEKGVMVHRFVMTLFSSARYQHRGTNASYWWWYVRD
jgi:hypothetical protein